MIRRNFNKNIRPFTAVCDCFGRHVIYTRQEKVTADNILEEISKALPFHEQNVVEIEYLSRYYAGDCPILYRRKRNRPEVNNKVVVNIAQYIVDVKTSEIAGEPIQYVLHGTDEEKAEQINRLNSIMDGEDKSYFDIELCRWRSICGTAYRFIGNASARQRLLDESPLSIQCPDPTEAFVVYYDDETPAFGCMIKYDVDNNKIYWTYTPEMWFKIVNGAIEESGINGNGAIPIVEYPNNKRRLGDIEITISLTDEINKLTSDRANGIEQYVQSWIKFINCDIDIEKFRQVRDEGFFSVTSNNGSENRSDVDIMSQELDQSQAQVAVDDIFEKLLVIQGIANRQGNTGGDTAGAVSLRNGHYDAEKRAELSEPIFKRAERQSLRLVLNRLRIDEGFTLMPSDVEIKISRSKLDNMLTKAEVLQILLSCGINNERAIKTVGLFSDPQQVATESKARMDILYPTTENQTQPTEEKTEETIDATNANNEE